MDEENLRRKISKKCFVMMKSGWQYTGTVMDISDGVLFLRDKFGNDVEVEINSISVVSTKN